MLQACDAHCPRVRLIFLGGLSVDAGVAGTACPLKQKQVTP